MLLTIYIIVIIVLIAIMAIAILKREKKERGENKYGYEEKPKRKYIPKWTLERREEWLEEKKEWDSLSNKERDKMRTREGRELPYGDVDANDRYYQGPPFPWEDGGHIANKKMVITSDMYGYHVVEFVDWES